MNLLDKKVEIIKEYLSGKLTRQQAAMKLNCSLKTISRLKSKYLKDGEVALIHRNTGKTPVNKTSRYLENKITKLYKQYNGFNFTHFLDENLDIKLSDKTITRILNKSNYFSPKSHKKKKTKISHPLRHRKEHYGELIQMDASELDWLRVGKKYHLHLAVDDATNTIVAGYFGLQETTSGYIKCLSQILNTYGIPKCFYTDNRTTFNIKRSGKSIDANIQFKRICNSLGIDIKTTSVPEAKGRVERYNGVCQDRLSNELKFNGVKSLKDANKYLNDVYIPKHNNKFSFLPNKGKTLFSKLNYKPHELNLILGLQYTRKVLNGNVISIKNTFYKAYENNTEVKFWKDESIVVIFAFNGQMFLKRPVSGKLHSLKVFKSNKVNPKSHPMSINHPWRNPKNFGKPIRDQIL